MNREEASKALLVEMVRYLVSHVGERLDNERFMLNPYCDCDMMECNTCERALPNFRHKRTGLELCWYKYIGRSTVPNIIPNTHELLLLMADIKDEVYNPTAV